MRRLEAEYDLDEATPEGLREMLEGVESMQNGWGKIILDICANRPGAIEHARQTVIDVTSNMPEGGVRLLAQAFYDQAEMLRKTLEEKLETLEDS